MPRTFYSSVPGRPSKVASLLLVICPRSNALTKRAARAVFQLCCIISFETLVEAVMQLRDACQSTSTRLLAAKSLHHRKPPNLLGIFCVPLPLPAAILCHGTKSMRNISSP